jgi:hypothetical protein
MEVRDETALSKLPVVGYILNPDSLSAGQETSFFHEI